VVLHTLHFSAGRVVGIAHVRNRPSARQKRSPAIPSGAEVGSRKLAAPTLPLLRVRLKESVSDQRVELDNLIRETQSSATRSSQVCAISSKAVLSSGATISFASLRHSSSALSSSRYPQGLTVSDRTFAEFLLRSRAVPANSAVISSERDTKNAFSHFAVAERSVVIHSTCCRKMLLQRQQRRRPRKPAPLPSSPIRAAFLGGNRWVVEPASTVSPTSLQGTLSPT
jgi:hypothetical protein